MEVLIGTPFIAYFECKQKTFKSFIDPKLKRFKEKVEAFGDGAKVHSLCFFDCLLLLLLLMTHNNDDEMTRRRGAFPIPLMVAC
jgi:hypothetical protein